MWRTCSTNCATNTLLIIAPAFRSPGKTFRDEIYPGTRPTAKPCPRTSARKSRISAETAEALGWPCILIPGMEADDVIGTLTKHAVARGVETIISTGDKDLAQLIEDGVCWYNTMSNEKLRPQGITEKFGVPPNRIVDYLTLMGDSVDNVPGWTRSGRRPP